MDFTISVLGDLSFYQPQLVDAYDSTDGSYDFSHNFEAVQPYLDASDFVMANFNSVSLGDRAAYSVTIKSNTPESIFNDLNNAGIDALMTATRISLVRDG